MAKRKLKVSEQASLSSRGMLVELDCGAWTGRTADMEISGEVAERKKADKQAGVYMKRLLARGSTFDEVISRLNSVRSLHRRLTLPWKDRGPRILPSAQFMGYMVKMRKAISELDKAVIAFIAVYPKEQIKAKTFLGSMFDKDKYPPAKELREKFYARIRVLPVPDAGDFRVSLPKAEMDKIREDIITETQESIAYAMQYLWVKVYKPVAKFADRLEGGKGENIRQGILNKLNRVCDTISSLSLVEDKRLLDVQSKIRKELVAHSAETLRDDKKLRADVARKARQLEKIIVKNME